MTPIFHQEMAAARIEMLRRDARLARRSPRRGFPGGVGWRARLGVRLVSAGLRLLGAA